MPNLIQAVVLLLFATTRTFGVLDAIGDWVDDTAGAIGDGVDDATDWVEDAYDDTMRRMLLDCSVADAVNSVDSKLLQMMSGTALYQSTGAIVAVKDKKVADIPITDMMSFSMDVKVNSIPHDGWRSVCMLFMHLHSALA